MKKKKKKKKTDSSSSHMINFIWKDFIFHKMVGLEKEIAFCLNWYKVMLSNMYAAERFSMQLTWSKQNHRNYFWIKQLSILRQQVKKYGRMQDEHSNSWFYRVVHTKMYIHYKHFYHSFLIISDFQGRN